jgi:hypothetical protein
VDRRGEGEHDSYRPIERPLDAPATPCGDEGRAEGTESGENFDDVGAEKGREDVERTGIELPPLGVRDQTAEYGRPGSHVWDRKQQKGPDPCGPRDGPPAGGGWKGGSGNELDGGSKPEQTSSQRGVAEGRCLGDVSGVAPTPEEEEGGHRR